jgi:lipopolysaccharide export system protein LptA
MRTTLSSSNVTIFNPSATNAQVRNVNLNTDCTLTSIGNSSGNKNIYVTTTTPASTVAGHTLSFHYTATAEL